MNILCPTFEEILQTKAFKSNALTFEHPRLILDPVLRQISPIATDIKYTAIVGSVNVNEDSTDNQAYSHLMMEATMDKNEEYENKVLFIYRLDKNPSVTVAYGPKVSACLNMCVFGAKYRQTGDPLKNGFALVNDFIAEQLLPRQQQWKEQTIRHIEHLKSQIIPADEIDEAFGMIFHETLANRTGIKLDTDLVTAAMKHAFTQDAMWSVAQHPDWSKWDLYNCLTQGIKNKPFESIAEKSLAAYRLVDEVVRDYRHNQSSLSLV